MSTTKTDFNKLVQKREIPGGAKEANDIESAIKKIHDDTKNEEPVDKEKTTRVSVDTPVSIIKLIKRKMLDKDIQTLRDYFLELAKKDLGI